MGTDEDGLFNLRLSAFIRGSNSLWRSWRFDFFCSGRETQQKSVHEKDELAADKRG
jgi:hypothetical protein